MSGLRQKQKADRACRILQAATDLFRQGGYPAARIEDIAAAAEVSVGTFYNYFGTKGDVLLAIVTLEVEEVLMAGEALLANPPCDVATALTNLIDGYLDHSLVYLSKEMWRTAMAITIEHPDTPFSARYTQLDAILTDQICTLIAALQCHGHARRDIDAQTIGEVLFNNLNMMFIEFVKNEPMPLATLQASVARQTAPLAALLKPT
jgi:AcrR family transcriptional regulator